MIFSLFIIYHNRWYESMPGMKKGVLEENDIFDIPPPAFGHPLGEGDSNCCPPLRGGD
jgi:hypothetical protein